MTTVYNLMEQIEDLYFHIQGKENFTNIFRRIIFHQPGCDPCGNVVA